MHRLEGSARPVGGYGLLNKNHSIRGSFRFKRVLIVLPIGGCGCVCVHACTRVVRRHLRGVSPLLLPRFGESNSEHFPARSSDQLLEFFEAQSHVVRAGLEVRILPLPAVCWDMMEPAMHTSPCTWTRRGTLVTDPSPSLLLFFIPSKEELI